MEIFHSEWLLCSFTLLHICTLGKRVPQCPAKHLGFYLKQVARLCDDVIGEAECARAEEVDMNVTWMTEQVILEVMMLKIAESVGHICFAAQKRFLPYLFPS